MNGKAQMAGQVFIYVMSIVVVGMVVVFGFRAVNLFVKTQEEFTKMKFIADFDETISLMDFGDLRTETYSIPKDFKMVCFVSDNYVESVANAYEGPDGEPINPLVKLQWADPDVKNNVFLTDGVSDFFPARVKSLKLDTNLDGGESGEDGLSSVLCLPSAKGTITLKLEHKGKYIFISPKLD